MWVAAHTIVLHAVLRQVHGNQPQMLQLLGCVGYYQAVAIRLCQLAFYPEQYPDLCPSSTLIVRHDLLLVRLLVTKVLLHLL
jgi:hypothetical protein